MSTPLGPVVYGIEINKVLVTDFPLDVELRQAWGRHDLFFIRIEYPRTFIGMNTLKIWPDNAPVKIVWGRRPNNIQTWYGYVNHHNVSGNSDSGSKAIQVTYVCIGSSKPMNTDKNRTWGNVTPTYIARKIASEYGFRTVLTSTDWLLPYEVQANESDFCFLNRIADKVGYRFWVSGGTLYFIDPAVILQQNNQQSIPSFRMDKMYTKLDTIREFYMNEGDNLPGAAIAFRTVYGLDENSGNVFQATADTANSPSISQIKSDRHVASYNEAKNIVQAWESLNQWWISAKAELFGTSALYPGKLIYLDGLQMPPHTRGYWIVASSTHILKASGSSYPVEDKFISQVEIIRNATGLIPTSKNISQINPEFVSCNLNTKGKWTSTSLAVLYDGVLSV